MLRRALAIAYRANVTGMAGMVAYSAVLALVPLVLLALFAVGLALDSPGARAGLLTDLERIFPGAARATLTSALDGLQSSRATLGVTAAIGGLWAGVSFWSAIDTAFRAVYGYPGRSWIEQKRWALRMLALGVAIVVVLVALPAAQALTLGGTGKLPLGLGGAGTAAVALSALLTHALLFAALSAAYHLVPPGGAPWRAVWAGALTATVLVTAVSLVFPIYLSRISSLAHAGAILSFMVVVLLWFYVVSLAILAGAAVNAAREPHAARPAGA